LKSQAASMGIKGTIVVQHLFYNPHVFLTQLKQNTAGKIPLVHINAKIISNVKKLSNIIQVQKHNSKLQFELYL
jgi:hypothetical protein